MKSEESIVLRGLRAFEGSARSPRVAELRQTFDRAWDASAHRHRDLACLTELLWSSEDRALQASILPRVERLIAEGREADEAMRASVALGEAERFSGLFHIEGPALPASQTLRAIYDGAGNSTIDEPLDDAARRKIFQKRRQGP